MLIEDLGAVDAVAVRIGDEIDVILNRKLPAALRDIVTERVQATLNHRGQVEITYLWSPRG